MFPSFVMFTTNYQTMFITVVFCLPTSNPVTSQTLNYTPVAVGIVMVLILGSWIWACKWFTGPIQQIEKQTATQMPKVEEATK